MAPFSVKRQVNWLQDMQTQVLTVDEIHLVNRAIFIIQHRNVLVRHTSEAKIHHALTVTGFAKIEHNLVTNCCTIQTPDVTTTENNVRLVTFKSKIKQNVIERFFDISSVQCTSKVVR